MPPFSPSGRRRFLQASGLGLSVGALPARLTASSVPAAARRCLLIYLDGGPSHLDLFDLKPLAPAEIRGPCQPIATTIPGVEIGEHLPLLARQMHRVTLIRSVTHEQTVHDPAVYQMLTGYKHTSSAGGLKVEADDVPQMGAAFGAVDPQRAVMPKVIQLPETMRMEARTLPGQNSGFLGPAFDPFCINLTPEGTVEAPDFALRENLHDLQLQRRAELLRELNASQSVPSATESVHRLQAFQQQALDILDNPQIARAFDLHNEAESLRDRYGRHRHGQSVLLARRLLEAGARFVTVYWGREDQGWADGRGPRPANNPWDTHRNHFPLMKESLAPRADQTLAAVLEDLDERSLLDDTLVLWMGEFGRTPRISRPWASRDHWPSAFSILMAGGGIARGRSFGATDNQGAYVTQDPVTPADLTATVYDLLGVAPESVVRDHRGQPHRLSPGRPLSALYG